MKPFTVPAPSKLVLERERLHDYEGVLANQTVITTIVTQTTKNIQGRMTE